MTQRIVYHGTLVNVHDMGVLIQGDSGVGKSLAALSLMRAGHRLVADDLVAIRKNESNKLMGQALEENVRIEVRGLGVFKARSLFKDGTALTSPIDIVVELTPYIPERDDGRISPDVCQINILDCLLDKILAPVASGVNPGFLVEMIAKAHAARIAGKM
ncbi:MAG: hypothetical protein NTY51_14290 [Deltaproteobacteria bacterium]|nr:hypothetical protein [Deltaproteobacteria bacterium]